MLVEPHTFYDCSCTGGSYNCRVRVQFGTTCAPVLSCYGPDGGLAAVCLSGAGISCAVREEGGAPICAFPGGVVPEPCGNDSCAPGCKCLDPAAPSCACQ